MNIMIDPLNEKYNLQQNKKRKAVDSVDKIAPNIHRFTRDDVDDAICRLVQFIKANDFDPEIIGFVSERLSDISRKNLFASNISANSAWIDLCNDRNLVDIFPGTYGEIANKYGIS